MSVPPYRALAVANEFVSRALSSHRSIDPMKLQKLVYFAHGWNLGFTGKPLINEKIEAWTYGPVVPSLYHLFKFYGGDRIKKLGERYNANRDCFYEPRVPESDSDTHKLLDAVWDTYGSASALELSDLSHEKGSPWDETVRAAKESPYGFRKGQDIDDALIHKHFKKLAEAK